MSGIKDSIKENLKAVIEPFPSLKRAALKAKIHVAYTASSVFEGRSPNSMGNLTRLTPNDGCEYFFGYYDKSPWDATGRYLIALKAKCTWKDPAPKQSAELVLIDTQNGNAPQTIATTHSWNSQQSCMAQWLGPDFKSRIIYNDFRNGKYCSVIYNITDNREEKQLSLPIYDVAKDGTFALTLDFSRLHRLRPGYGYSNLQDCSKGELCPVKFCIWRIDLSTSKVTGLVKYTDLAEFELDKSMAGADHKVNHIMINPSGTRFMVIHRWFDKGYKHSRLVTIDCGMENLYNLSDDVFVSHCYWKSDTEILGFVNKNASGRHYYLMTDQTQDYKIMWPLLDTDGHCSYSPDGEWVITDTYPDKRRMACVYLCNADGKEAKQIAGVFSPLRYFGDCRCDLHPRWSRDGRKVCIDSAHDGKTGVYEIDVRR